jgi:hypothetical protein
MAASAAPHSPAASAAPQSPNACGLPPRIGHIAGIVPAMGNCPTKSASRIIGNAAGASNASDPAEGTPPLIFHGGSVMMTPSTSPVTVTPIFWNPSGNSMDSSYISLVTSYLNAVSVASGQNTNVFSVLNEYSGTNGQINYSVKLGTPIIDTTALPSGDCTVASTDTTGIYADGSGYSTCLSDFLVQAEMFKDITVPIPCTKKRGCGSTTLPVDLSHVYVMFLPKHVESCINSGSTTTASNACTVNHQASSSFCGYHSFSESAQYANLPFPVYQGNTAFTCGNNGIFGTLESPNGNPDGDVVVNLASHEISEMITDPDGSTGWFDSSGFEVGDECSFVFGATQGTAGQLFNQTINGLHFLTQEEFSNNDFAITGHGCVQSAAGEA